MKKCRRCGEERDPSDFGSNRKMTDGKSIYCLPCARVIQQEWRASNLEKARLLDRQRKQREQEQKGREFINARQRNWYSHNAVIQAARILRGRNPNHRNAHRTVERLVKLGILIRPDHCSNCGALCKPDGHHPDYSKPQEVVWLCRRCHRVLQEGQVERRQRCA